MRPVHNESEGVGRIFAPLLELVLMDLSPSIRPIGKFRMTNPFIPRNRRNPRGEALQDS